MKLRFKINMAVGAIFILVLVAVLGKSYYDSRTSTLQLIGSNLESSTVTIADNFAGFVESQHRSVRNLAEVVLERFDQGSTALNRALSSIERTNGYLHAYLGKRNGLMIMPDYDLPSGYDPRERPWYRQAVEEGGSIMTAPYQDAADGGSMIISFAAPVKRDGELLGVVGVDVPLADLIKRISRTRVGTYGNAYLLMASGEFISHPKNPELVMRRFQDVDPSMKKAFEQLQGSSGLIEYRLKGKRKFVAYAAIPGTELYACAGFPLGVVEAEINKQIFGQTLVGVAIAGVGMIALIILVNILLRPIARLVDRLRDIAEGEGDLSISLDQSRTDELGKVGYYFNEFMAKLRDTLQEVNQNSNDVAASSTQLASNVGSMNQGVRDQESRTTELAAAIEQMNATVAQIAENAQSTAEQSQQTFERAQGGQQSVGQTVEKMSQIARNVRSAASTIESLGESASQIGAIIDVINDIADQTNLLALNAAIEAARAGEHGRGFAVVADEVRKLAERTQEATQQITQMISGLQGETQSAVQGIESSVTHVEEGNRIASDAGARLDEIIALNQQTTDMITQIATAAEQQSATTSEISRNVDQITESASDNARQLHQVQQATEHLSEIAEDLHSIVGRFQLSTSGGAERLPAAQR